MEQTKNVVNGNKKSEEQLETGTYEVIRNRLLAAGNELNNQLIQLNQKRRNVFGSYETILVSTERIHTENSCIPADMVSIGTNFIFGYNIRLGLKTIQLSDVFCIYKYGERKFTEQNLDYLSNPQFQEDFKNLYTYYKNAQFYKFAIIGVHLYMIFKVGRTVSDIKAFKWLIKDELLHYIDNRSEHEFVYPQQHEFQWQRPRREDQIKGKFPHISIENKIFVETLNGDLTIKIENNTETGAGIFSEPVENKDQTLDDAEFYYAVIGNIIILKVKPYQEKNFRYIVYNQKIQEAKKINSIEDSCILLPEGQGLIFANGYYLQSGEYKLFDHTSNRMFFERRIASPNGEDYMYIFYNKETGNTILLSYNLIEQKVSNPVFCNGYTIFPNGEMCLFKTDAEAQKYHSIQIWQTQFITADYEPSTNKDSFLYKIGNKDIVRAMAECKEIYALVNKQDSYSGLYIDLVKKTTVTLDTYQWINHEEIFNIGQIIGRIRETANAAIDEYEKVLVIKKKTFDETNLIIRKADELLLKIKRNLFESINDYVQFLIQTRVLAGEIISLKELRYCNTELIIKYETEIKKQNEFLSENCISFLLKDNSLEPYNEKIQKAGAKIEQVVKVADADEVEKELNTVALELEMLTGIINNLKIKDATQTTGIIEKISAIYSGFNQIRAALKRKRKELFVVEGKAEFNAQIKMINQGVVNYIEICETPSQCDEYLTKAVVQLEELEGKFAEFDEFIGLITEKREEIINAFEAKKNSLTEILNKKTDNLLQSGKRIITAIENRITRFTSAAEINGYFASDLMVEKLRNLVAELLKLGDTVKADDLQSRMKSIREDAIRQLKDKSELFEGDDCIKFGNFIFTVNRQPLTLITVLREQSLYFHLTGTGFFEKISNPDLDKLQDVWNQNSIAENNDVYKAEYLAYKLFEDANKSIVRYIDKSLNIQKNNQELSLYNNSNYEEISENTSILSLTPLHQMSDEQLKQHIQIFMSTRFDEGYIKGVHDVDAFLILKAILKLTKEADLIRYSSQTRACAELFWTVFIDKKIKDYYENQLKGLGSVIRLFPNSQEFNSFISELNKLIQAFAKDSKLFDQALIQDAGEYLFYELCDDNVFTIDKVAVDLYNEFINHLKSSNHFEVYQKSISVLEKDPVSSFKLIRTWVRSFVAFKENNEKTDIEKFASWYEYIDETSVTLLNGSISKKYIVHVSLKETLTGFIGSHRLIENQTYKLEFNAYLQKCKKYDAYVVPKYKEFVKIKNQLISNFKEELRLEEFQPRIMSSFVRNQLIDKIYLPLIGANLAKQIGAAGEQKRTDLMGMLLLISPPGYGKTTLMEYIANRLGITFVRINSSALGHQIVSLDPQQAANSNAAQELEKLNLAFEMGDNVMIYLDDIQHCNPEFLQKFITLCDAQRKIEGVYKKKSKTYDFRGKKVCVVMAGNPYTESGEKFKIPDMLSNRADIYNLGDIIGGSDREFKLSYIENCLVTNKALSQLATKSYKDLYILLQIAETGDKGNNEFEAEHSTKEIDEYISVLKKLIKVRDVLLKVNHQYIYSAGQADEFRTEPAFKLQGSYRNMNKIAEKIVPVMNDSELNSLIISHYENESQTLTRDAEANLLKFKALINILSPVEINRWNEIKELFQKNQRLKGYGSGNQLASLYVQLENLTKGVIDIKEVLEKR